MLDEENNRVAVQSDTDCKKTIFSQGLLPVAIFFSRMFNSLTEYMGKQDDGLHYLKVRKLDESNEDAPNFFFVFDGDHQLVRARLEQTLIGHYDFEIVVPLKKRMFSDEDWYVSECEQIEEDILQDSNSFAGFLWTLVETLLGTEEDILSFLGYSQDASYSHIIDDSGDDEDFAD